MDKIASGNLRLDAEDLLKACIAAIRAGRVMQVDGHAVAGPVRWNHNLGLILHDAKGHQMAIIPPDRVYRLTLNTDTGTESAQPHVESLATVARSGFGLPGLSLALETSCHPVMS